MTRPLKTRLSADNQLLAPPVSISLSVFSHISSSPPSSLPRMKHRHSSVAAFSAVTYLLFALAAVLVSVTNAAIVVPEDGEEPHELGSASDDDELLVSENRELAAENPGFNIAFTFASSITKAQKAGFIAARNRWQSIITRDYDTRACVPAGFRMCGYRFKRRTCIDDLLIIVRVKPIDGTWGILGQAGPCGFVGKKVRIGIMEFDSADANALIKEGSWQSTVLHEMGHVLGIGSVWEDRGLITPQRAGPPYYYLGSNGNAGLQEASGTGRVLVEDKGGPGTARGHWKESVYDNELMTGYIESTGIKMPISKITVRSLADLGYTVDVTKADSFRVPSSGRRLRSTEEKHPVGNDVFNHSPVELPEVHPKPGRGKKEVNEKDA